MNLKCRTTIILGACVLGSGVPFQLPAVYAESPQPLLAQVSVEVYVIPHESFSHQNYVRFKHRDYRRNGYPNYRYYRDYRGNDYYYPHNFYKRSTPHFIRRDYWGNPVYGQQDFWAPAGFNRRDFDYHGW